MNSIEKIFSGTRRRAGTQRTNASSQLKVLADRLPLMKSLRLTDAILAGGLYWIIDRRMKLDHAEHEPPARKPGGKEKE